MNIHRGVTNSYLNNALSNGQRLFHLHSADDDEDSSSSSGSSTGGSSSSASFSASMSFSSRSCYSSSDILQTDSSNDNDSFTFSTSSDDSHDTMDRFMESYFNCDGKVLDTEDDIFYSDEEEQGQEAGQMQERRSNQFGYSFGNFMECNYYRQFLCPEVREQTYIQSNCRKSRFRSHFRVPLS